MDLETTIPETAPTTDLTGLERPVRSEVRSYWQAQGLAELTLSEFQAAMEQADREGQRRAFYLLANYYGRTLYILRGALAERKEALAQAALRNLIVMHRPLAQMHRTAPHAIPLTLTLEREARDDLARDLVVRVLAESPEPMKVAAIIERVNDLDLLGMVVEGTVRRHLKDLIASGHAVSAEEDYARSGRTYAEVDLDALSLHALTGTALYAKLDTAGFHGLRDVDARQSLFRSQFPTLVGLGDVTAELFLEAVRTLLDTRAAKVSPWRHADLIGSPYPRPYQYETYAVFRGHGYQGQVIESPTGSGKTMIGMMCIQDWLRTLHPGQSILVLVPTANYQQQWIGELCYKPIGLRLSPDVVFSGTPQQLERFQRRTGEHPAIILLTYTALAQVGSAVGKGGFDVDSIEMFLQGANVQYVILDEVHKVVDNMASVSADVTRQLVAWLRDGSLRGLIGFSGTAEAYRPRFAELGLELVHLIPMDDLIAYGFVAPFAEYGMPFANSARERRIRDLLDAYKERLREYFDLLGSTQLRRWFAEVPLVERFAIGRGILGMYRGRANLEEALNKRLTGWEKGGAIAIPDAALVTILQIARGWPDAELVKQAGADPARFATIVQALEGIRRELADLIYLPQPVARLRAPDFGLRIADFELSSAETNPKSAIRNWSRTCWPRPSPACTMG